VRKRPTRGDHRVFTKPFTKDADKDADGKAPLQRARLRLFKHRELRLKLHHRERHRDAVGFGNQEGSPPDVPAVVPHREREFGEVKVREKNVKSAQGENRYV